MKRIMIGIALCVAGCGTSDAVVSEVTSKRTIFRKWQFSDSVASDTYQVKILDLTQSTEPILASDGSTSQTVPMVYSQAKTTQTSSDYSGKYGTYCDFSVVVHGTSESGAMTFVSSSQVVGAGCHPTSEVWLNPLTQTNKYVLEASGESVLLKITSDATPPGAIYFKPAE